MKMAKMGNGLSSLPGADREYVIVDTETTGLYPGDDAIVSVCARRSTGEVLSFMVDPDQEIPEEASDVHGIVNEHVAGLPQIGERAEELREFIGDRMVVAHNLSFDLKFLNEAFVDAGLPVLSDNDMFCTMLAWRRLGNKKVSLDSALERIGLERTGDLHSAEEDVALTAELLAWLQEYGEQAYAEHKASLPPKSAAPCIRREGNENGRYFGKRIVFTGALRLTRAAAADLAAEHGFRVVTSVSKKTDVLVVGAGAGSKLEKARALVEKGVAIEIADESTFMARVADRETGR